MKHAQAPDVAVSENGELGWAGIACLALTVFPDRRKHLLGSFSECL